MSVRERLLPSQAKAEHASCISEALPDEWRLYGLRGILRGKGLPGGRIGPGGPA